MFYTDNFLRILLPAPPSYPPLLTHSSSSSPLDSPLLVLPVSPVFSRSFLGVGRAQQHRRNTTAQVALVTLQSAPVLALDSDDRNDL